MREFDIFTEICLGFSHCGGVYEDNSSEVELSEADIETLYGIMEKAYAEEEGLENLDLRDTDLKKIDKDLYDRIYDAYYECAREANFAHWTENGYMRGDVIDGVDWDDVKERCVADWGYDPESEEDFSGEESFYWVGFDNRYDDEDADEDEEAHFLRWFKYRIVADTPRLLRFERIEHVIGVDADEFEFNCPLLIPPALVEEFLKTKE